MDWSQCSAIECDPQKVSGAWVFRGTRVPVQALFENIDAGATINEFLEWFPGVTREQVDQVLMFTADSLASA
ncbi:MAG: DUF433 domain-containing protein [Puniceicoccales bacterium]